MPKIERRGRRLGYDTANVYYVYALVDPRTDDPFYIGKGKDKRYAHHEAEWRRGHRTGNRAKLERIGEIFEAGLKIEVRMIAENLAEEEAYRLESAHIAALKDTLTNAAPGGQGRLSVAPLARLEQAISRMMRPHQWKIAFLRKHKRLPRRDDWDGYFTTYTQHLRFRDELAAKLQPSTSDAKKDTA